MSSTNRGGQRRPDDYYATPSWCVDRLLEAVQLPSGPWLEPSAGEGHIVRAVNQFRSDVEWTAVELSPDRARTLPTSVVTRTGDFLALDVDDGFVVAFSNPPFSIWQKVVDKCLTVSRQVVMLLRLDVLGSAGRAPWWARHPADVFILPNRPSFTGDGKQDSNNYAWFMWTRGSMEPGRISVLSVTPKEQRIDAASV